MYPKYFIGKYNDKYFIFRRIWEDHPYTQYLMKDGTWYDITISNKSTCYYDTIEEVRELAKKYNITIDSTSKW